jgi:hypothetical protein
MRRRRRPCVRLNRVELEKFGRNSDERGEGGGGQGSKGERVGTQRVGQS